MPEAPQLSVTPSSTTTSISGSAKRRSTRIPGRSEEAVGSSDIANVMGDQDPERNVDQTTELGTTPTPQEGWKHPAELQYIRRADWSQDLMITYLCQKSFTVPPRQPNTTLSYTEITRSFSGEKINVPRGYRIPLMFVAKFQWESLRLVLNNASEWEEYKFDIIHLSRLCTHFFKQAKFAASENKLTKAWRSPMFDRALIRFYRKWMVSREWSVKKFWEEFEEDEYKLDVLKFDWSRWVLKGHKGFVLTKEEVQNGVTADQYREGLKRRPDGTWMWGGDDSGAKDAKSLDALTCLASQDAVEAITDATPSHDSIEVKEELLELDNEDAGLNNNGKRRRDDEGNSPRKLLARLPKKSRSRHKMSPRKKPVTNPVPICKSVSSVSSVNERPIQQEEDTTIEKDASPQSSSLSNNLSLKFIPSSHVPRTPSSGRFRRRFKKKSTSSTTTTMATVSTDAPTDQKLDLPTPTSTNRPRNIVEELLARVAIPDEGVYYNLPFFVPADALMSNPNPKTISNPLYSHTAAQSEADSSSAPGNSNGESNSISNDPSTQIDPEIVPDMEISDPVTMNDPIVDAPPLLPQSSLPSSPIAKSTNSSITALPVPTSPEVNLPTSSMAESPTTVTANPDLSSTSPNVHDDLVSVLPPSLPQNDAVISDNSIGPVGPDPGNGDRDLNPTFLPELKVKIFQTILDTVQRMTGAPQTRVLQARTRVIDAVEERNNIVDESIAIPLSPILSQNEQLVYPADLISGNDEIESIVVVEAVDGTSSGVTDGINPPTVVPAFEALQGTVENEKDMDVEGAKEMEGAKDLADGTEVMDTMGDLVDDTGVSMENYSVETQVQSYQETPTADNMDEVDVAMEKVAVNVHTQSRQETPMNGTHGVSVVSEVGVGESRSLGSSSFMGTSTASMNNSTVAHDSVLEAHGDSREVAVTHVGNSEDKMNVDEEIFQPIPRRLPFPTDGTPPTTTRYITPAVRTKSLHSIQLLQGLIHFLQMPAQDKQLGAYRTIEDDFADHKGQATCPSVEQAHYPLLVGPCSLTEEAITVDQRLDVLAHVSVTLAKNLYPYRGKELETRIDTLTKSLQQQFELIQKLDSQSCGGMDEPFRELAHSDTSFNPSTASTSTETISQGIQTLLPSHVNRQFESVEVQTEVENEISVTRQPISADATMVDLTIPTPSLQELPSASPAIAEARPESNGSVTRTVMSMMRNMADLLECATQETSQGSVKSLKGKEKEVVGVDMMPSYLDSPAFTTILEEFKSMREEIRRSQHRSLSEVESLRLSHFMEVQALKDEIRNIESRGKQELEEITRQYSQQIGELRSTIRLGEERERTRDREKESGSSLELLELRRRVASLEARCRSDSSTSRASMANGHFQEPRHPNFHLPHLLPADLEEQQPYATTFRAPRQYMREESMSKPGTPAPSDRNPFGNRHPDAMDLDESMPLPAKSQRKMYMMNFPRPPLGG